MTIHSGLPNRRLKLPAPVLKDSCCNLEFSGDRLTFVNRLVRRRSLSAIR